MTEEEWQFLIILVCGGIVAAAIIIVDVFSLQKFWARYLRSKNPPTPRKLVEAHTRHHRFYHHTSQRLFSTTYVSFYLFVLSYIGILLMGGYIIVQNALKGSIFADDERLLKLSYIVFFFLLSRWNYRQESHHTTAHKLIAVLTCVIFIDLVHLLTGAEYLQVATILLLLWIWMIGIVRAVVNFDVNYRRDVAYSCGIPFAIMYFLIRTDGVTLVFIIFPLVFLGILEFLNKSELEFQRLKNAFPTPLPFKPFQPDGFLKDIAYSSQVRAVFKGSSLWEILFWFFMTPIILIPVTMYLQSREEQLHQWHETLVEWSHNQYVIDPETVADRLGLALEDTYPLLNELTEEGSLAVYEGWEGLTYGLPPSGEMQAFVKKLNLKKTELPQKDRDLLEYIVGKRRVSPPKTLMLSIIKRTEGLEVSTELRGGTISALKSLRLTPSCANMQKTADSINCLIKTTISALTLFRIYKIGNFETFLSLLQKKGRELLECTFSQDVARDSEMSHIILETNVNEIPFELMWADNFLAVTYAMGRRLRTSGPMFTAPIDDTEHIKALIVADPSGTLRGATAECDYVQAELDALVDTTYVPQTEASCKTIIKYLRSSYTIIHYAGHVSRKGLRLLDGVLTPERIQRNLRGNPLVFVNGCTSAGVAHTGLAEAFLRGGALGYIGSFWDIHDVAAAQLAIDFYTNALHHYTIGEALRMAKEKALTEKSIAWLCFVLFGDPTLQLL